MRAATAGLILFRPWIPVVVAEHREGGGTQVLAR
jgi:hypothetical protein